MDYLIRNGKQALSTAKRILHGSLVEAIGTLNGRGVRGCKSKLPEVELTGDWSTGTESSP